MHQGAYQTAADRKRESGRELSAPLSPRSGWTGRHRKVKRACSQAPVCNSTSGLCPGRLDGRRRLLSACWQHATRCTLLDGSTQLPLSHLQCSFVDQLLWPRGYLQTVRLRSCWSRSVCRNNVLRATGRCGHPATCLLSAALVRTLICIPHGCQPAVSHTYAQKKLCH